MNYTELYKNIIRIPNGVNPRCAGSDPNGSKTFPSAPSKRCDVLFNIFGEQGDKSAFEDAFYAVTNGKGQELKRITTLHSSSLLGLLMFWRVSEHWPLTIDGVRYTKVFFELESPVFGSNSSIDTLLVSKDKSRILYLELKFTEFLSQSNYHWLDTKYIRFYQSIEQELIKKAGISVGALEKRPHKKNGQPTSPTDEFKISLPKGRKNYLGGIKQMISHAIGVAQGLSENDEKKLETAPQEIILGTMRYDFKGSTFEIFSNEYANLYRHIFENSEYLMSAINGSPDIIKVKHPKFKILGNVLTYQKLVADNPNFPFGDSVMNYYGFK